MCDKQKQLKIIIYCKTIKIIICKTTQEIQQHILKYEPARRPRTRTSLINY